MCVPSIIFSTIFKRRRCHVWLSYSLHVREHFLDFEKNVGALYSLQHDNLLVSTQHSMLVQWQLKSRSRFSYSFCSSA
jgi:hypothetical protein